LLKQLQACNLGTAKQGKIMQTADLIITNARLLTMNRAAPRAESLAIAGNRILAVGSNADVKAFKGGHTRVIDAQMNTVMPGIVESHIHLFGGAVHHPPASGHHHCG
jgi:predicted amidohydrolase YtcJ